MPRFETPCARMQVPADFQVVGQIRAALRTAVSPGRVPGRGAGLLGLIRTLVTSAVLVGGVTSVSAHKASDSYLQIEEGTEGLALRWDIALRDLDVALDLDLDGDGRLDWGEIKAGWPRIEAYALAHLQIEGCDLRPGQRALERRNDGAYAVLHLSAACRPSVAPAIAYTLFREVDPTHRGIAKIQLGDRPLALMVLDPMHAPDIRGSGGGRADAVAGEAGVAGDATAAAGAVQTVVQAATSVSSLGFAKEGVRHILTGYDHVLFLLCLLLPSVMRRTPGGWQPVERLSQAVWPVFGIVSAFTVAHSITLALAATGIVSLSPSFIEPAIAATIVLAALDNVWPVFPVRRVVVTFFFGLIHGFGFASVLAELNLPTARFAWALLQFNLGIEAGQLTVVMLVTAILFVVRANRGYSAWVIRGGSYAAMLLGVVWLIERAANVSLFAF